ncbi:MAG: YceI family protein [Thermoanaerobaculia bacterium]|jgi:polyisoprenoid-binding protein YceI
MLKRLALIGTLATAVALSAAASERTLTIDPAASKVDFKLGATGHDVEGSFKVESGSLTFDTATGVMSGEIHVDAKSAKTGNGSRDNTMHGDVLESAKFPLFTFKAQKLEGHLADAGKSTVKLHGIISVHGVDHALVMPATVDITGNTASANATFSIPFVDWGMKDPSILFLRVEKSVVVTVTASGTLTAVPAQGGAR